MRRSKKNKPPSHKDCQTLHSIKRIEERYGLQITPAVIKDIVNKIHKQEATVIGRQTHTRTHYLMEYDGHTLYFVYDKSRKSIRTFLPYNGETVEELKENLNKRVYSTELTQEEIDNNNIGHLKYG